MKIISFGSWEKKTGTFKETAGSEHSSNKGRYFQKGVPEGTFKP